MGSSWELLSIQRLFSYNAMPLQQVLAKRAWLPTKCSTRSVRAARTCGIVPRAFMTKHDAAELTTVVERFVAAVNAHDVEGLCNSMSQNVVSLRSRSGGSEYCQGLSLLPPPSGPLPLPLPMQAPAGWLLMLAQPPAWAGVERPRVVQLRSSWAEEGGRSRSARPLVCEPASENAENAPDSCRQWSAAQHAFGPTLLLAALC